MATPPIGNIDLSRGQAPYNPNMGEYLVPANRSFTWESSPQEQGLLASAMGRSDLKQLLNTGQWGPLAGQPYQYQGGRTPIGYGGGGGYPGGYPGGGLPPWQTGGYPPWQGGGVIDGPGTGGTVIIDGPGDTNGGKTYGPGGKHDNYHDWYMDRDNPFGHYWALENAARGKNRAIGEQEVASQVDQFAVNPFQGAGRNWTAPEQQANIDAFRKDLAAQPMGTSQLLTTTPKGALAAMPGVGYANQGIDFSGMPSADVLAARQAAASRVGGSGYQQFDRGMDETRQLITMDQLNRDIEARRPGSISSDFGSGNPFADRQRAARAAQADAMRQSLGFGTPDRSVDLSGVPLAMKQQRQTAQADAMRKALGFGTPDRSVDLSGVGFQPQTSTPFAQQKAEAARIAQTKPQRDAAAVVRQTQQQSRGGAESKKDKAKREATEKKRAAAKALTRAAGPSRRPDPKVEAAKSKKAAAAKKKKAYVAALSTSQAKARKKNIESAKKKEKRAAEAKKKGYATGPDMRRR